MLRSFQFRFLVSETSLATLTCSVVPSVCAKTAQPIRKLSTTSPMRTVVYPLYLPGDYNRDPNISIQRKGI